MTEPMRRRRALMAQGSGSPIVPVSTLTAGDTVKVTESGSLVDFVYIGINNDGNALLLRGTNLTTQKQFNSTAGKPEYSGCTIDTWLKNTVKGYYTGLTSYFRNSNITYATYNDAFAETINTIQRDIYIPSAFEVTGSGNEGGTEFLPALKIFKNTTAANTARATGSVQWLRTEYSASSYPNRVRVIAANGSCTASVDFTQSSATNPRVRPVLSIDANTPIVNDGGNIIVGG